MTPTPYRPLGCFSFALLVLSWALVVAGICAAGYGILTLAGVQ